MRLYRSTVFNSVLLAASLVISLQAHAQATFGAEFNFTNSAIRAGQKEGHIVNSPASEAARDQLMRRVTDICNGCWAENEENAYGVMTYKITYPDGWYFEIATDPQVVEIQTKASTADEIAGHLVRIQTDIFEASKYVGMMPANQSMSNAWAGSHIHVGAVSSLGEGRNAVRLLKDFMVDFSNHSELAEGIFTNDMMNAPPLYRLPQAQRDAFTAIAADVDSGKIKKVKKFAKRVRKEVYNVTVLPDMSPTTKYHAFNVNRIGNSEFDISAQTWELRAMRGQESAQDFLNEIRLIDARLKYLKSRQGRVSLNLPAAEMNETQKAEHFYRYVTETGLDFTPYEKFLSLTQMYQLPKIKERNRMNICRSLFN